MRIWCCLLVLLALQNLYARDPKANQKYKNNNSVSYSKLNSETINLSKEVKASARIEEPPALEPVNLSVIAGSVFLNEIPGFKGSLGSHLGALSQQKDYVYYSLDPKVQKYAEELIRNVRAPHAAIVMMDPKTGRILALAQKSKSIKNLAMHAGFPAASLFKIVTTAAALENTRVASQTPIRFRGSTYELDRTNYLPNAKLDRNSMTLESALGKSCNPVFARIALQHLNSHYLKSYAKYFGFNTDLKFDSPIRESSASIPATKYDLARTAAGFGDVYISPIHAASMMSLVANGGSLPRPILVDHVANSQGKLIYGSNPEFIVTGIRSATAKNLLNMMQSTTTTGTSAKEFSKSGRVLGSIPVAAKTGTLKGTNPVGLNRWFIGAAPINSPEVTVSVIVVNPSLASDKPSHLARKLLEKYFQS